MKSAAPRKTRLPQENNVHSQKSVSSCERSNSTPHIHRNKKKRFFPLAFLRYSGKYIHLYMHICLHPRTHLVPPMRRVNSHVKRRVVRPRKNHAISYHSVSKLRARPAPPKLVPRQLKVRQPGRGQKRGRRGQENERSSQFTLSLLSHQAPQQ